MAEIDWESLQTLSGAPLRLATFRTLQTVAEVLQDEELDDPVVLASVPRLAALISQHDELSSFIPVLSTLARAVGLWNYIDADADERDQMLAGAATVRFEKDVILHREQIEALNTLLAGRNLILSAPTSFGKSLLIDVLLSTRRYRRVAIVLPTIALLDEFRKRLSVRFGGEFEIIMHHSQVPTEERGVIFLGTQERLINREDIGSLDLLVVDEFYKLDPARRDDRSLTLNAAVYRLIRRARQFFFLGPNIEGVRFDPDGRWKFEFLRTKFSTVAVDTFDMRNVQNKFQALSDEAFKQANWPALVFVSGPDAATTLAKRLQKESPLASAKANELSDWIAENFGESWSLVQIVRAGIGLHHGRIPRSLASMFIRMFNAEDRALPILLCTSTLIEGVNTAAKSVLIYDKVINKSDYDFFTFSNIKGRAGRLGEHLIGQVFLFHSPPASGPIEVGAPVFEELDNAPNEIVVHLEGEERSAAVQKRVNALADELGLSLTDLRRLSSLGIETLGMIKRSVSQQLRKSRSSLIWSGYAEYKNLLALSRIACDVKSPMEFGAASAAQLERFIRRLRQIRTFKLFFQDYAESNKGYEDRFENVFRFLRSCEYSLPEIFQAIEIFVKAELPEQAERIDYSLLISEMSRWFQPEVLKILEERGVPIQIAERYYELGDTVETLSERLLVAAHLGDGFLKPLEREWVSASLPISIKWRNTQR
jgi:hypothetical protein